MVPQLPSSSVSVCVLSVISSTDKNVPINENRPNIRAAQTVDNRNFYLSPIDFHINHGLYNAVCGEVVIFSQIILWQ